MDFIYYSVVIRIKEVAKVPASNRIIFINSSGQFVRPIALGAITPLCPSRHLKSDL